MRPELTTSQRERALFYGCLEPATAQALGFRARANKTYTEDLDPENTEDVKKLQKQLKQLGYDVPTSGLFEQRTVTAVQQFQLDYGVAPSDLGVGWVDAATRTAIDKAAAGKLTSSLVTTGLSAFTSGLAASQQPQKSGGGKKKPKTNWPLYIGLGVGGVVLLGGVVFLLTRK